MTLKDLRPPLYFIALTLPSQISKEVEAIKKELRKEFSVKHALKLEAHVTLQIPFRMPETKEKILIKKLGNFANKHKSFSTELDGFGRFAKNVIFIKIKDHDPFIQLHQDLQEMMLNFLDLKSHEISSKIHPHITLATRDLKRSHFPEIWEYFKGKEYIAPVEFKTIELLKHNGKVWTPRNTFKLSE